MISIRTSISLCVIVGMFSVAGRSQSPSVKFNFTDVKVAKAPSALAGGIIPDGIISQAVPSDVLSDAVPTNPACEARANDTSEKLLECIQKQALWSRLAHFQKISDQHVGPDGHGNRDTGTGGYHASLQYVEALMRQSGYRVTVQSYPYTSSEVTGVPQFSTADRSYSTRDWFVARLSGGGTVTASIRPETLLSSNAAPAPMTRRWRTLNMRAHPRSFFITISFITTSPITMTTA
jgi:hypothetical protein